MTPRQSRSQGRALAGGLGLEILQSGPPASTQAQGGPASETVADLLRRQAALLAEVAEISAEISAQIAEIQVAASADTSVMGHVIQLSPDGPALAATAPFLTVADVARRLHVDPRTVRRWRQSGVLPPAVEVSGVIRWRAEVIEEWVLAREQGQGQGRARRTAR